MLKAVLLALGLAFVASLVALSGYGRVEEPTLRGSGPLAIEMPAGLSAPSYHAQPSAEWWRARHGERVDASGSQECLGCHNAQTSCDHCHAYVGVAPVVAAAPALSTLAAPTPTPGAAVTLVAVGPTPGPATAIPTTVATSTPSFAKDIAPILEAHCRSCHGTLGGLDLSSYERTMNSGEHKPVIVAGNPDGSLLIQKVRKQQTIGTEMPPGGALPADEIDLLVRWIAAGAPNN